MSEVTNWASRQKAALQELSNATPLKRASGGGETITSFYRFTVPTKEGSKQLVPGQEINGVYQGSPKDKTYGKYFHKVKTITEGLIALPSAGQLDKAILSVAEGATVKVIYNGKTKITTGKFAGKDAHSFEVFASAFKE